jgi:hypothetical protein
MNKIYPETLLQLMLDVLKGTPEFIYISGTQPFLMSFNNKEYFVYVKNLSSAYFKERPDTTRAQLPIRDNFENIKKSPNPFIFLGYDQDNDVLVCWNFHIVKTRLNEKKSVSFYSRQFFQDEVSLGNFLRKRLKNGDEPILFKRKNLIDFFKQIDTFFPLETATDTTTNSLIENQTLGSDNNEPIESTNLFVSNGKLLKITDTNLIEQLKPLIDTKHSLEALKFAADYYKGQFPAMKLKDWNELVKNVNCNEPELEVTETQENIKPIQKIYSTDNVRNRFVNYMQDNELSEASISHYIQALSGRISEGIRNYLAPDLSDIFKVTDILLLQSWLLKLFKFQEYILLDEIGKKMYSCALKKYIQFVEFLSSKDTYFVAEPQAQYITSKSPEFTENEKRKEFILKVTYPDGRIVAERVVYKTLLDVIKSAGVYNVYNVPQFSDSELRQKSINFAV